MQDHQELATLRTPKGSTSIGQAEVEAQPTYDKDQIQLARVGKKQVLKVRLEPKTSAGSDCSMLTTKPEKLWLHVNAWIQLYSYVYVGRGACVRMMITVHRLSSTMDTVCFSLHSTSKMKSVIHWNDPI